MYFLLCVCGAGGGVGGGVEFSVFFTVCVWVVCLGEEWRLVFFFLCVYGAGGGGVCWRSGV